MTKRYKALCSACHTENEPGEKACTKCGLPLASESHDETERKIVCPRCLSLNNAASFFCYKCGKYFADVKPARTARRPVKRKRGAPRSSVPRARVLMPGGDEITLTGEPVFIERSDFNGTTSHEILMKVSRQHALITFGNGQYYVKDYGRDGTGSTNHTRLNGIDIHGKRKKPLKDGDKIELANQPELTLTFRLTKGPK